MIRDKLLIMYHDSKKETAIMATDKYYREEFNSARTTYGIGKYLLASKVLI